MKKIFLSSIVSFVVIILIAPHTALAIDIGVFYYPGWRSDSANWKDIKGMPGSRSPNRPWPELEPLIGYYPEEEPWVAEKHIDFAAQYGITFFAYDWYWDGRRPEYDHALRNYLKAANKAKLKFCLLWANHYPVPKSVKEFDDMVAFWLDAYFVQPTYYRIDQQPVVFIFSNDQLGANAKKFGESSRTLLARANNKVRERGFPGIYFILTTNAKPGDAVEGLSHDLGFNAYSGWNYAGTKGPGTAPYDVMVDSYLEYYEAAARTKHRLPYIVPASPGWDSRPWLGNGAVVRSDPSPEKFERMLLGARQLLADPAVSPKVLMIEAWNEFGEGSVIEPTKKWGVGYLETIRKVFGP